MKEKCEIKNPSAFDSFQKTEYEKESHVCEAHNPTVDDCKAFFKSANKRDQGTTVAQSVDSCLKHMPCDWSAHYTKFSGSPPSVTVSGDGNGGVESLNATITLKIPDPTNEADNLISVGSFISCLALILSIIIYF